MQDVRARDSELESSSKMSGELRTLLDRYRREKKEAYPRSKSIRNWIILAIDIAVIWGFVAWYWVDTLKDF
ncbi:MAG: hypothetical protein HY460_00145 [Parcubacteria group bacterium]|nr:hypothetical protein [Parcubacteria group bacterium]